MWGWLLGALGALGAFFAQQMAKKTIFVSAVVAGALALTAAFMAVLQSLAGALSASVPGWVVGLGYMIPDNGALCFSTIVSAKIARWVYDYHMSVLKMAASV